MTVSHDLEHQPLALFAFSIEFFHLGSIGHDLRVVEQSCLFFTD